MPGESDSNFRALVEQSFDAMFVHTLEGAFIDVNPAACRSLGYTRQELLALHVRDVEVGIHEGLVLAHWRRLEGGVVVALSGMHRRKDATLFPVEARIRLIDWGEQTAVLAVARDLSEQAKIGAGLRESESHFRTAFEQAAIGKAIVALDGHFLSVNRALCEIVGYTESELLAIDFQAITHADDLKTDLALVQSVLNGERPSYQLFKRYHHKLGHICWVLLNVAVMRDEVGKPLYFLAEIQDVTETKITQDALRRSEEAYRGTFELAGVGMAHTDLLSGRFLRVNRKFCDILGYTSEELLSMNFMSVTHPDDRLSSREACRRLLAGELKSYHVQKRYIRKDTTIAWIILNATIVTGADGKPLYTVSMFNDITELIRVQEELRRARDVAEQATVAKSEFLRNMSHEIRTPMTAILGYLGLLEDSSRSPHERSEYAMAARRNGEHLLHVLNDILDLSKIEAGKLSIERRECSPANLIAEIELLMRVHAAEKGLAFTVECDADVPQRVLTDPTRVRQVLFNLIGNAIKFTESGSVRVRVSRLAGDHHSIRFDVSDTGIGISSTQQSLLFVSFSQADASSSRSFGGTGLGLAISKRLASMLGGSVTVRSELGKGSVFSLIIHSPVLENTALTPDSEKSSPLTRAPTLTGRILVAEDSLANLRLVTIYLEEAGLLVEAAADGRSAVDKTIAATKAGNPFSAILMDMQMPEMDGYSATRELRRRGHSGPIIAFTAHVLDDERGRCLHCGCDDLVTKPIDRDALVQTLQRYIYPPDQSSVPVDLITSSRAGDPVLRHVLKEYVAELPAEVRRMTALFSAGDYARLRQIAHQLKGSGQGYGFAQITALAAGLESQIASENSARQIKLRLDELIQTIRRIEGYNRVKEQPL